MGLIFFKEIYPYSVIIENRGVFFKKPWSKCLNFETLSHAYFRRSQSHYSTTAASSSCWLSPLAPFILLPSVSLPVRWLPWPHCMGLARSVHREFLHASVLPALLRKPGAVHIQNAYIRVGFDTTALSIGKFMVYAHDA